MQLLAEKRADLEMRDIHGDTAYGKNKSLWIGTILVAQCVVTAKCFSATFETGIQKRTIMWLE